MLTFIIVSCNKDDFVDLYDENNEPIDFSEGYGIKITKYMDQEVPTGSLQGVAAFDKFLFQFEDCGAAVYIYNLEQKKLIKKVFLTPNNNNHCNQLSFSNTYFSIEDKFPLLYVSGARTSGTYNHVQVYRITGENESIDLKQIQEIILPQSNKETWVYWTCIIMDNDKNHMCAYANSSTRLIRFNIPNINIDNVNLYDSDIIDFIKMDFIDHQQGGVIRDGILYIIFGVPGWGDKVTLRIFDIENKKEIAKYNLSEINFTKEPEGLFFYNNELYCATNNAGIYKINFKKN